MINKTKYNKEINSQDNLFNALEALKKCDSIVFNSFITNEEAFLLQKIKEKFNIRLVNFDAYNYQFFLKNYSLITGKSLYSGTNKRIEKSDAIITIGTKILRDSSVVKDNIENAIKKQNVEFIYMHPLDDEDLKSKYTQYVKYEVGSEEAVIALLAKYLLDGSNVSDYVQKYFDDLDDGYLSGESSVGEEEFEQIVHKLKSKNTKTLVVGDDLYSHSRASNISKLVGLIDKYSDFNVVCIPTSLNTLGVSLLCELDKESIGKTVGYHMRGDFTFSNDDNSDFHIPKFGEQEGSFCGIDLNVLKVHGKVGFKGQSLQDLSNDILDDRMENIASYKKEFFTKAEFEGIQLETEEFTEYDLIANKVNVNESLEEIEDLESYNGTIIYTCEAIEKSENSTDNFLKGSKLFATAAKINSGDTIDIIFKDEQVQKIFKIDEKLQGNIALYSNVDTGLKKNIFKEGYRFKRVKIYKVEPNGA